MLASAHNVRAVLAGQSLSDSLALTSSALRAPAQAVTFHTMRHLGLAREIKQILVRRQPPDALADALLLVALALADTAAEYADDSPGTQDAAPAHAPDARGNPYRRDDPRRHQPVYAPHTVVDQAVWAMDSQRSLRPFKSLLNGTLRTFLRERPAILAQARQNPEAFYNHPDWWIEKLRRAYPDRWEQLLEAANVPGPMILRVNARRSSVADMLRALDEAGIEAIQVGPAALALAEPRPVQAIPGFEQGWWSVQDLAAQQAAQLLALQPGMRVLDACAAPGGKSAHILELADVHLTALDADARRLGRVRDNLRRLGLEGPSVETLCADAADLSAWWDGKAYDAVLADVPCTASGVLRRHPDIRWLRRERDIPRTAALQARIVDALWKTVRPGGHLLYATCSIFPQEGELQAVQFTRRHPDASRLAAPGQMLPLPDTETVTHDGFFYALFAKKA